MTSALDLGTSVQAYPYLTGDWPSSRLNLTQDWPLARQQSCPSGAALLGLGPAGQMPLPQQQQAHAQQGTQQPMHGLPQQIVQQQQQQQQQLQQQQYTSHGVGRLSGARPSISAPCSPSKPLHQPSSQAARRQALQQRLPPLAHHNSAPYPSAAPMVHHPHLPTNPLDPRPSQGAQVEERARCARSVSPSLSSEGSESYHALHKVPQGDSPYVRAKHVQLVDKDPEKAIALFWSAINAGDRVDSALKDMAIVMKQQNRAEEAIEAIKSLRHKCSEAAQESLDNVLLDLYKRCGRLDDQINLLKHKLDTIRRGVAFNGKRTKTARSQGKKFQVSIEQEATRLLGNLGWAYMQQDNFVAAETVYRKALAIEPDNNKVCNLGICLMKQGRVDEARIMLKAVTPAGDPRWGSESHLKSFERAQEMLKEMEAADAASGHSRKLELAKAPKDPQAPQHRNLNPQPRNLPLNELLGAPSKWDSLLTSQSPEPAQRPQQQPSIASHQSTAAPDLKQAVSSTTLKQQHPQLEHQVGQASLPGHAPAAASVGPAGLAQATGPHAQKQGPVSRGGAKATSQMPDASAKALSSQPFSQNSRSGMAPKCLPPRQQGLPPSHFIPPRLAHAYSHQSPQAPSTNTLTAPVLAQPREIAPAPYVPPPQPHMGFQDAMPGAGSSLKPSAQPFLPASMLRDLHQSSPSGHVPGAAEMHQRPLLQHSSPCQAPTFTGQQGMAAASMRPAHMNAILGQRTIMLDLAHAAHVNDVRGTRSLEAVDHHHPSELLPSPRDQLYGGLSGAPSFGSSTSASSVVSWEGSGFMSPPVSDEYLYPSAAPEPLPGYLLGPETRSGSWPSAQHAPHVPVSELWAQPVPAEALKQRLEEESERQRQKEALLANSSLRQASLSQLPVDLYAEPGHVVASKLQATAAPFPDPTQAPCLEASQGVISYPSSVSSGYGFGPNAGMAGGSAGFQLGLEFGQYVLIAQQLEGPVMGLSPADLAPGSKEDMVQVGPGTKRNRVPTPTKGLFHGGLLLPAGLLASGTKPALAGGSGADDVQRSWENLGFTASPGLLELGFVSTSPLKAGLMPEEMPSSAGPPRGPSPLGLTISTSIATDVSSDPDGHAEQGEDFEAVEIQESDAVAAAAPEPMTEQDAKGVVNKSGASAGTEQKSPNVEVKRQRRLRIFEEMSTDEA